jgi:hypothetical protein
MAKGELPAVLRDIHALFHMGTSNGLTDAQLLDRFRARSDLNSSEDAFAGLMARHGPTVLGVCRRALSNPDEQGPPRPAATKPATDQGPLMIQVEVADPQGRRLSGADIFVLSMDCASRSR